jgi:salicylate hydroxylase
VLLAAFLQKKANGIHLGAQVTHYTEYADRVQVHFTDGRVVNGDCLIAADGIRSKIRSQLVGDIQPRFTGNVAWRGVLPADQLPANFMQKVVRNFVGPNKHMVIYYLRQQQLVNFVGVVENKDWQDDSWVRSAPWEELKADFEGWHPMVQAVIDGMHKSECYRWALFDHKPIKRWSSDRVTLLGDAAHATLPFMASGAAMAIEDGRILQRALDQAGEITQGLVLYQANRFKRTKEIQNSSRQLGKLYHINNRLALKMAFKALSTVGRRKERFLPEYDANTVELL